jgi:hypothetical protein
MNELDNQKLELKHHATRRDVTRINRDSPKHLSPQIWSTPFFQELTPEEKLIYIYLFSKIRRYPPELYEISLNVISFQTGLSRQLVKNSLYELERISKINIHSLEDKSHGMFISMVW